MRLLTLVFLVLFTAIASADSGNLPARNALDVLQADLNNDGRTDRAILIEVDAPFAQLVIFTANQDGLDAGAVLAEPVWSGLASGQVAHLRTIGLSSFQIESENSSIGRNRWRQIITMSHRNGIYRVVGYTYEYRDTLDLKNNGACDINYLSGKADVTIDGKKTRISHRLRAIDIREWTVSLVPDFCYENAS